ncbi:MAG TPA: hypothetical protein VLE23_02730 [Geminicoccaceae bacterium]|nr:hypothetical protein [Geminicoccaceae bacterium]
MVAHPAALLGPTFGLTRPAAANREALAEPWILRLARPDFVAHLLAELADGAGRDRLGAARVQPDARGLLVLEQPVHRSFNLVLLEARCLIPGLPRLDPSRVLDAGLAVRRLLRVRAQPVPVRGRARLPERRTTPQISLVEQAWLVDGKTQLGWQTVPAAALFQDGDWEPDATARQARVNGRHGAATRLLLARLPGPADARLSEATTPLFPIPDDLALALGRSMLFGFLPVTSAERVEPGAAAEPPFARADVRNRVPLLLRSDRDPRLLPPVAISVTRSAVRPGALPEQGGLRTLVEALTWLAQETALFEGGAATEPLTAALDRWPLRFVDLPSGTSTTAALARLYRNLLGEPDAGVTSVRMPATWPAIGGPLFEQIVIGGETAMRARFARSVAAEGRFDDPNARYRVRCFARLSPHDPACPPEIVWSAPSAEFRIKAWYEGGEQPPVPIELPRPDRLRGLRPDVAFKVPPELQRFMDRLNLQGLLDGDAKPKAGIDFGMICSFSIPIITLCAFIVLQIFLVLLNIIFFWLPFVRICLPFPKPADEEG